MREFLEQLKVQRWDDHRYYHHSRINQALHLLSALSFLCAYVTATKDPASASLIGWLLAMTSRQAGHFFFEPKGYDAINQATHEYKESIKVGYNLKRKIVLLSIWALSPFVFFGNATLWGMFPRPVTINDVTRNIGYLWLYIGVGGLLFRTVHLFFVNSVQTGLVWATKILTDPLHDVKLYYRAPAYLLRGELFDAEFVEQHQK